MPLTSDQVFFGQTRNWIPQPQECTNEREHSAFLDQHEDGHSDGFKCIKYLSNMGAGKGK